MLPHSNIIQLCCSHDQFLYIVLHVDNLSKEEQTSLYHGEIQESEDEING